MASVPSLPIRHEQPAKQLPNEMMQKGRRPMVSRIKRGILGGFPDATEGAAVHRSVVRDSRG